MIHNTFILGVILTLGLADFTMSTCVYDNSLPVPTSTSKCSGIGGSCIRKSRGCGGGKFVSYHCPGRDVCCVPLRASDCDRHLANVEGNMYLQGYIPTSGSGVTIASGVDIGQRLPSEYSGLDRTVYSKIVPYAALGHGRPRNKAQVCGDNNLNSNRLSLSLSEAQTLDKFLRDSTANKNSQYSRSMNRGKCVVRSLNHYCGDLMVSRKENKCNFSNCDAFIRNALIGGTATDSTFEAALVKHRNCISTKGSRYSHVAERFKGEICYLNSRNSIC